LGAGTARRRVNAKPGRPIPGVAGYFVRILG
jgi:hypothetical protein